MKSWWVYIIEKRGEFYVGITIDIMNRLRQHGNIPLLYKEGPFTGGEAAAREKQIKHWSRAKKEALIVGDVEKLQNLSKSRKEK